MGNMQGSHEISVEEQEMFEMQVEEDYNPKSQQNYEQAKLDYLMRRQKREAEQYRKKYLQVDANQSSQLLIGKGQMDLQQDQLQNAANKA